MVEECPVWIELTGETRFTGVFFVIFYLCRPVLSRGQTIDGDCLSCCSQCSDDLVTVLEMVAKQEVVKRPFKVTDRLRQIRKGIVAKSLKDLIRKGEILRQTISFSDLWTLKLLTNLTMLAGGKFTLCLKKMVLRLMMKNISNHFLTTPGSCCCWTRTFGLQLDLLSRNMVLCVQ